MTTPSSPDASASSPQRRASPELAENPGERRRERLHAERLLVALFVAVISLPLAANLAGIDGADLGAENRELAAFPRVDGSLKSIVELPTAFTNWFDDHFGFRSRLVRWYGESRLFVLQSPPSAAVVLGEHGWLDRKSTRL